MTHKVSGMFLVAALSLVLIAGPACACTWAAFANGRAAVVARTLDWYRPDGATVKGHGRNVELKAADTPNALTCKAKYASIQIHSFASGIVSEAMNEKGLQGGILFLDGSELPAPQPGRQDVSPNHFIAYAVSNFATVQEVVDDLARINLIPDHMGIPGPDGANIGYAPEKWPGHFALADATGDKVVIESLEGKLRVYHGPEYDVLTNEPPYEIHRVLIAGGYQPSGGIFPVDRLIRAKRYLRDMYERGVDTPSRALLAMRGLLASVSAGTEEIDRVENEVYPTLWWALADLRAGAYYLTRIDSWCAEIYDFSMFDPQAAEVVGLKPAACPYAPVQADAE